ncbi:hypothetical protein B4110_0417 [Parageobacillus toebii]|uniref:Uncharacterized protein n=1 Tax=Parageobacillus toebii TaxID=153151 RepID=A0A150MAK6_9BACL|nr:hypothetical protein B4110_0417 [Parageobacillus toebii]
MLSESIIDDGDGFIIVAFVFFIVRKQQPLSRQQIKTAFRRDFSA